MCTGLLVRAGAPTDINDCKKINRCIRGEILNNCNMPRHDNQSEMNEVLMNVMTSLADKSGKQFMTAVELREMMQATAVEMNKLGYGNSPAPSMFCHVESVLDRFIAGDESMLERVPKWPKNKDELVTGYNDTWHSFHCAHMPRKVTRKEWKLARVQVRNGIFYPIVDGKPDLHK
jgi:hypothetical protein